MTGGLCECGCGEPAPVAQITNRSRGARKGQPQRFIQGHNMRVRGPSNPAWGKPGSLTGVTGRSHPAWKGGRYVDRGYVRVYAPDHPRANGGYVFEHILVAEAALGAALPGGAVVHHVNGDEADNRPPNLVVCQDHSYHMLLHSRAGVSCPTVAPELLEE